MSRRAKSSPLVDITGEQIVRSRPLLNRSMPDAGANKWYEIKNSADTNSAEIFLYDEIGGWWGVTAGEFISELKRLDVSNITLHVNSPGGEVFDAVAIYNALRAHKASVKVIVDSLAASAASFIAQAGDEIVMNQASTMMIHDALGVAIGNQKDMLDTADILDKVSNNIASIYAARAGGTTEEWRALMQSEVWYTAEEAVAAGLADSVSTTVDEKAAEAKNRWDFSLFNFAGRDRAPSPEMVRQLVISNRAKEAPVGNGPKNTDTPAEEQPVTSTPESPAAPASTEVPEDESADTEAGTPAAPVPATPETPAPDSGAPSARSGAVLINGVQTTDMRAIQAHINMLENFQRETIDTGRKTFVENLVREGKMAATQVDKTMSLVNTFTDEQWQMWSASWEAAPSMSLLGDHTPGGGGTPVVASANDEIEILEGTVQQHLKSGMPKDKIENTPSYKKLKQLKPEFAL